MFLKIILQYKEISFDQLGLDAQEVDGSGTQATEDRLAQLKLSEPGAGGTGDGAANNNDVPIDEDLFEDSDLPDSEEDDDDDS